MKRIDIFPWDDHFNTGLVTIDKQHRKLVRILNLLASQVAYDANENELNKIFEELVAYTEYHFQTEEKLWHKYLPNDELDSVHQAVHQEFLTTVLKFKNDQKSVPISDLAEQALGFLSQWLASHILETDRHMSHIIFALQEGLDVEAAKKRAEIRMSGSSRLLIDIILANYKTLSTNTLHLMKELKAHQKYDKELDKHKLYSDLLLDLSTDFVSLPLKEIDSHIHKALKKMANYVGADRSYIFVYDFQNDIGINTYEWCNEGIEAQIDTLKKVPLKASKDWVEKHKKGEYILIQDVYNLEEPELRKLLLQQDIKSLVTFPIYGQAKCKGFIGFDSVKTKHTFNDSEIRLLELFSKLLFNIEERRDNELMLSNERSLLKSLLQAIPDLVWLKDLNGIYRLCNSRFEDYFGSKEEHIIGKTDFDFLDEKLASSFLKNDKQVIQTNAIYKNEELITFANDQHKEMVYTTKVPMHDKSGNVIGVLGIARDITAVKNIQQELENKEHYQRALLDNFPFMVWLKDENSNFLALNKPMALACGFDSATDLSGKNDYDVWPKKLAKRYRKDDFEVLASNSCKTIEEPLETKNGSFWSETYKSAVSVDGKVIGTVGFSRDITESKELQRSLIKERNLFKYYLNTVEAIIVSLDLQGKVTLINRKGCEILEYSEEELIGKNWFEFCLAQPEGKNKAYPIFINLIEGNLEGIAHIESSVVNKFNKKRLISWHYVCLYDEDKQIIGTLSSGEDISVLREQQNRLEYMAHYDLLTNLPNRILLSDRLHQAMLQIKRNEFILAVIYLDLDGFKEINDTYGHDNGDLLLKYLSNKMKQILRSADSIGRFGGDEFVIILPELKTEHDANIMLNRILDTVSQPIFLNNITMKVSASIGVTFYDHNDYLDADQLLRQADQAMYQAKLLGKNRFHIFDLKQDKDIRSHHENLEALEKAIINKEFVMHYQPKVNMRSGKLIGAEALIRWNHPEDGLVYPGEFLPAIENHHLSVRLGYWVIEDVLKQIKLWKKENYYITVSINITPLQLQENDFILKLLQILDKYPEVSTSDFKFEILESSALENINDILYIMKECIKIGIVFLLDDFGTGYSSLTYLKNLPAKQLKIDQSFIRNMLDNIDDMAILEGVISLANAFRREVIAEGIETIEQGSMLLRLGCEEGQGNFIGKPMSTQDFVQWISKWKCPVEWKKVKTLPRDDSELLYAITEHKLWTNKVIAYFMGKSETPLQFEHDECRFGLWLHSSRISRYKNKNGFQELVDLHKNNHAIINTYIKQHQSRSLIDVENAVKTIKNNRKKFIDLFNVLFF